ncbi:MAG TPA: SRPBCC domain-containing protein [Burkholderiaceae bacterium]|nr:SRPBCC domain-containing protein [Burkholderiaceae bacterium]
MREISTHVDIDAGPSLVWAILTDFPAYRRWNPLMRTVLGVLTRGNAIRITEQRQAGSSRGAKVTTVQRTLKHVREPRELYWLGGWAPAWLYATERRFRIESLAEGRVRFHQDERFRGMLVPFVWPGLRRDVTPAFHAMNKALKARAERAQADVAAGKARAP